MSTPRQKLDREIARVITNENCSGCGACTLLDSGVQMTLQSDGFNRPTRAGEGDARADAAARFRAACPGARVAAQRPALSRRHPTMGPIVAVFEAWAADPEVRHRGSSGGTLTALAAWLAETGEASRVIGAAADAANPRRTVTVQLTSRDDALAQAGSRYAPASNAAHPASVDPQAAIIGKPCEVSAVRALHQTGTRETAPLLLSFFCAGTPSQHATESLVAQLGIAADEVVSDLWYRGRGWPGRFTVERDGEPAVSTSYQESWGEVLGRHLQWRCKICPDGVGESSDVTAADLWRSDDRGYPDFSDGAGVSALIARTERGLDLIARAVTAGVLMAAPISINDLAAVQPFQRQRRETLAGRLVGTVLAGRRIPAYRGFSLISLALPRLREVVRTATGSYRRLRRDRPADD